MAAQTFYAPITKIEDAKRVVKGPVLRPEIRDRQGTIISADVIEKAAHNFLKSLNVDGGSKPGFMHKVFKNTGLEIVESFILDTDMEYPADARLHATTEKSGDGEAENIILPAGTWMMAMHVTDDAIWDGICNGTYQGFSIGGDAMVKKE